MLLLNIISKHFYKLGGWEHASGHLQRQFSVPVSSFQHIYVFPCGDTGLQSPQLGGWLQPSSPTKSSAVLAVCFPDTSGR